MYVDDILSGAHSIQEAIHNRNKLIHVLKSADFSLRKWTLNKITYKDVTNMVRPVDHPNIRTGKNIDLVSDE